MKQRILLTGSKGFIGSALCSALEEKCYVWSMARRGNITDRRFIEADLLDQAGLAEVCRQAVPDVVIHCAGLAHQKIGRACRNDYFAVNVEATENLAKIAVAINPNVHFIFMSSVSVYGEYDAGSLRGYSERDVCRPAGHYAESKLEAEQRLISLYENGIMKRLDILRLGPVYDREWTFNLDRRVLSPMGRAYLRFGSGIQRLSALARPNLVDVVESMVVCRPDDSNPTFNVMNVCDGEPYSFNRIIDAYRSSGLKSSLPVICAPLWPVEWSTRIAAILDRDRAGWWRACYDKLSGDLVCDNARMLAAGFVPRHTIETVLGASKANVG